MIQQLVYISTVRGTVAPGMYQEILLVSRRNNARDGVTGLLVAGGNRFLQMLEGPADKVRQTYARIQADQRHFATVVLSSRTVEQRFCPDWTMGYVAGGSAPEQADLPTIVDVLTAPIEDKLLKAQFTGFAELHSAAA